MLHIFMCEVGALICLCNFKKYHLGVSLQYFLCNLGMVEDNLLVPHLLDGVVSVALHGVVVLVDLYSESAARGEVVRLGKVTQTMMLDCLQR